MTGYGTELPIPNVRSSVAMEGKADKICSMRVLRILTRSGHRQDRNAAAPRSAAVPYGVLIFGRTEAVPNPISEHFRSNPKGPLA
jgi:hypothetical protein